MLAKRIAGAALAFALVAGGTLISAPAFADDTAPAVTPTAEATPAPAATTEPAPTAEPTKASIAAPAPAKKVAPRTVIAPQPSNTNVLVAWPMPSYVNDTTPTWPQTNPISIKQDGKNLNALDSQLTACGSQWQVDLYRDSKITKALLDGGHLDSPGHPAEDLIDGGWGVAYKIVHTAPCPVVTKDATASVKIISQSTCDASSVEGGDTQFADFGDFDQTVGDHTVTATARETHLFADGSKTLVLPYTITGKLTGHACYTPPPAQSCIPGTELYSDYYTEDVAPVTVVGGLRFDGTTARAQPVDTYHAENVPLAGINGLSYTITENLSGSPDPAYVLEILTTGTSGYTTLSWEPYVNGHVPNATGAFTGLENGKWWSSRLSTPAPGAQDAPITLAAFEELYPNAVIISHGVHLGSAHIASSSIVSETSFLCAVTTFGKPAQPEPIVTVTQHKKTDCVNETITVYTDTTTTEYVYDPTTNTYVLGTPVTVETSVTRDATKDECPSTNPPPVQPPHGHPHHPTPPTTPVVPTDNGNLPHVLGFTGAEGDITLAVAGSLLLTGLTFGAIYLIRRRKLAY